MDTALSSSATSSASPLNQGTASRKDKKLANAAVKERETEKTNIYKTDVVGTLTAPPIETTAVASDYYRNGKLKAGTTSTYEIPPRELVPNDFINKPASIRIWGKPPKESTFQDLMPSYSKFILESVQESHTERSQIVETFGDFYVFLFGERPPVYQFSGQLINSCYTNWVNDFMFMYETRLRGTQCVANNATALVTYGGRQIEGLILSTSSQTNAAIEGAVNFQFSVVVFERRFFSFSEDMGYSSLGDSIRLVDENMRKVLDEIAGPEGKDMSRPQVSKANEVAKETMAGGPSSGITPGTMVS